MMADLHWIDVVGRVLLASLIALAPGMAVWLAVLGLSQVGRRPWKRELAQEPAG